MSTVLVVLAAVAGSLALPTVQAAADPHAGVLDPSYGNGGIVTAPGPLGLDKAIAVQPDDGKAVVAGDDGGRNVVVMRYNTDGMPDAGFGSGGKVVTHINHTGSAFGAAVAIQPDRKIVVAGSAGDEPQGDFVVVRYQADGTLDQGFGAGGQVVTDFGHGRSDTGMAVAVQDGKIVVAGTANTPETGADFAVARYLADGSLDRGFGGDGTVTTEFQDVDRAWALGVQTDGKLVVAGDSGDPGQADGTFDLVRYNTDGSLDASFDGDGKVRTDIGGGEWTTDMAIQPDGRILVGGKAIVAGSPDDPFVLLRYQPDGSIDSSFGTGGKVVTDVGEGWDSLAGLALQSAEQTGDAPKIVAVGGSHPSFGHSYFSLARYDESGRLDPEFGDGGIVHTEIDPDKPDEATDVAIQPDGKILAVGHTGAGLALARYVSGGSAPEPEPCTPGPDQVAIYELPGYQGHCVVKGIGTYNGPPEFPPLPNDTASSIRVGADVEAILARDNNLTGQSETFTDDDEDFSDNAALGDDTMSSFKVQPRSNPVPGCSPPLPEDQDCDGLSDTDETAIGTDPRHSDTDGDGLLDPWEVTGVPGAGFDLDPGRPGVEATRDEVFGPYAGPTPQPRHADGRLDTPTLNFVHPPDPLHKDVYLELDWADCLEGGCPPFGLPDGLDQTHHAPHLDGVADVVHAFAAAPVPNSDGTSGIRLHVSLDEKIGHHPNCDQGASMVGNGDETPRNRIGSKRFGTPQQRKLPNAADVLTAKDRAFRYVWSGHSTLRDDDPHHQNCPLPSPWDFGRSGLGQGPLPDYDWSPFGYADSPGRDILVSLGPIWSCSSQIGVRKLYVFFGPPITGPCYRYGLPHPGIFPATVPAVGPVNFPINRLLGLREDDGIRQLWARTLMNLLGHSMGLTDAEAKNDPQVIPTVRGVPQLPDAFAPRDWNALHYAPPAPDLATPHGMYAFPDYARLAAADPDGDHVNEGLDNCPGKPNRGQADGNGNGIGDDCDPFPW